jgi:TatD DNase family protein
MSGPGWFDSHCHIQDAFRPDHLDIPAVLAEAARAGVEGLVCVGTDAASSRQAISLVERARQAEAQGSGAGVGTWATVGLHPHEAKQGLDQVESLLASAMSSPGGTVVAVGECGLDYHYDHSPRPVQREVFAAQIALARHIGLTLVVHSREAWDDTLELLREAEGIVVVVHCFTGGTDEARRCLDLGAYLSFSGIVTFPNAQEVRDAAALCPVDRLLVETDAPFLAPVPHRGRPNQPAWVAEVGAAVASVKKLAVEEVAASTSAVARSAFPLTSGTVP